MLARNMAWHLSYSFFVFLFFFRSDFSKMGEMSSFQLGVIGALFLSVASSVSIVICNKALMSNLGFPFGNFVSFLEWACIQSEDLLLL